MSILAALALTQTMLTVTQLGSGQMSRIEKPREAVARTSGEWQALWKAHAPDVAMPAADFSTTMIVGVFLGSRPTAGYEVRIVGAVREADRVVIEYVERKPPPDAMLAQVITSPFALATVPRHEGTVEFRRVDRP